MKIPGDKCGLVCHEIKCSLHPAAQLEPFLDKLCDDVEREQNREIVHMTEWLAKKSPPLVAKALCPEPVHGAHGGHAGHAVHGMNMGCGKLDCESSKKFMAENMVMHDGMCHSSIAYEIEKYSS